jgi:hypothetical protein
MSLMDELVRRTHAGARTEREIIEKAFGILDTVKSKAASVRGDKLLSRTGIVARLVETVLGEPWSHLGQLRDQAKAIEADIAKRRGSLVPERPAPTDIATAIQNSELRAMLRAATRADRLRLTRDHDEFAAAALTAHEALSGFGGEPVVEGQASDRDLVLDAYRRRHFSREIEGVELREEAAKAVNAALDHVVTALYAEAGSVAKTRSRACVRNQMSRSTRLICRPLRGKNLTP